ncbi:MAG TPA: hypothetical protein VL068_10920 [Microthrixaceae bacterium]|nr:hypothetical protein [Microthrixaceae bacterium]
MDRIEKSRTQKRLDSIDGLRSLIDRTRPVSTAEQKVLPVLPVFEDLLSDQGLRRGTTVKVDGHVGATSLALAVSAGPTKAGSWLACIGVPEMGWASASEIGVDLTRVAVIRSTESAFVTATAALVDAFDLVLCGMSGSVSSAEARRLTNRARERGSVLILLEGRISGVGATRRTWPEAADVQLSVIDSEWVGVGHGSGRLRKRRLTIEVGGRRGLSRPRRAELWLPGIDGSISLAEGSHQPGVGHPDMDQPGVVVPLRKVG